MYSQACIYSATYLIFKWCHVYGIGYRVVRAIYNNKWVICRHRKYKHYDGLSAVMTMRHRQTLANIHVLYTWNMENYSSHRHRIMIIIIKDRIERTFSHHNLTILSALHSMQICANLWMNECMTCTVYRNWIRISYEYKYFKGVYA